MARRVVDAYTETPEALDRLAACLNNLGLTNSASGVPDQAVDHCQEATEITRRTIETYGETLELLNHLAIRLGNLANAREATGDSTGAAAARAEAEALQQRLAATNDS